MHWFCTSTLGLVLFQIIAMETHNSTAHTVVFTSYSWKWNQMDKHSVFHRASLVPVFSFGENNLFTQLPNPQGSMLRKLQNFLTRLLGFSPPIFHGRGVFNYTFGLMPYRMPINTVCEYACDFLPIFPWSVHLSFGKKNNQTIRC